MCLIALGKKRFSKFAENGAFILFPSAPSATVWGGGKGNSILHMKDGLGDSHLMREMQS